MAYLRFGRDSEWYIFWHSSNVSAKGSELLSVWSTRNADFPTISYTDVKQILDTDNFERIPGFKAEDKEILKEALAEFIKDVDDEYERGADGIDRHVAA